MNINILKARYIALASEKPVQTWSIEDANLMSELAKDPDVDFLDCIADIPPKVPESTEPSQIFA